MTKFILTAYALGTLLGSVAEAQDKGKQKAPPPPMSFFVTSAPKGDGANYGGLAGADAHCQTLAQAANAGNRTWHAYLSTQGPGAVNARDRIGAGPWYNARGQMVAKDVADLPRTTVHRLDDEVDVDHIVCAVEQDHGVAV